MPKKLTIEQARQVCIDNGFEPLFDEYINSQTKILVKCKCGKEFKVKLNAIKTKHTTSCGRCNNPKIGDKFGKLTIIKIVPSKRKSCSVICKCDCGKKCGPYEKSVLTNTKRPTRSCGNCKLMRNGTQTSTMALKLHQLVEKILNKKCEHNYNIGKKCVDIVCVELRIAVEYDGYYWHRKFQDTTKLEKRDERLLKKAGYKFLRIRSDGHDIPTEDQLRKVLTNHFEHSYKKWTITMKSWKDECKKEKV